MEGDDLRAHQSSVWLWDLDEMVVVVVALQHSPVEDVAGPGGVCAAIVDEGAARGWMDVKKRRLQGGRGRGACVSPLSQKTFLANSYDPQNPTAAS